MAKETAHINTKWGKQILDDVLIYCLIFLVVVIVLIPIIGVSIWPRTHEGVRYILLLDEFKEAFSSGILYPRWLPDAAGGYGYPNFLFYQPGFFFAALPFSNSAGYPLTTMYATLILLFFLGGVGVYKLCRALSDPQIGLFCTILFLFTPYLYVNLYVRGALSELMAMLLCPWAVYFLILLKKRIEKNFFQAGVMVGTALSLLAVIIAHPATTMFFLPVFCLIALYISTDMGALKKVFLLKVLMSLGLALVLSSPYWFTIFQLKKYVNLTPALSGYYFAKHHVVYAQQFLSRFWGFGYSVPGVSDGMSFQLGLPHFLLAFTGMIFSRKDKLIRVVFGLYLFLIVLMTSFSSVLWQRVSLLWVVQFPWRILSVTALLQIICISGIKNIPHFSKDKKIQRMVLLCILILSAVWYFQIFQISKNPIRGPFDLEAFRKHKLQEFYTYTSENEFMPNKAARNAIPQPRGDSALIVLDPPGQVKELSGSNHYKMRYEITNAVPAQVVINQFYMPGWKVSVDGQDICAKDLEEGMSGDGRIKFALPGGKNHRIEAFYEGPPGWRARNKIMLILTFAFIAYCFNSERKRKRNKIC